MSYFPGAPLLNGHAESITFTKSDDVPVPAVSTTAHLHRTCDDLYPSDPDNRPSATALLENGDGMLWPVDASRSNTLYPFTSMSTIPQYTLAATTASGTWASLSSFAMSTPTLPSHGFSFREDAVYAASEGVATDVDWQSVSASQSLAPENESCPSPASFSCSSRPSIISSPYSRADTNSYPNARDHSPLIKVEDAGDGTQTVHLGAWGTQPTDQTLLVRPDDLLIRSACNPSHLSDDVWTQGYNPFAVNTLEDSKPLPSNLHPGMPRSVSLDHFANSEGMVSRRKRVFTKPENASCSCPSCGRLFQRAYNLKAHLLTHDPDRVQPYACQMESCTRRFVRRTDLIRHQQSVHIKSRNFSCGRCSASFSRRDTLRRHEDDGCARRPEVKRRLLKARGFSSASLPPSLPSTQ